jgi:hypothetical protein
MIAGDLITLLHRQAAINDDDNLSRAGASANETAGDKSSSPHPSVKKKKGSALSKLQYNQNHQRRRNS